MGDDLVQETWLAALKTGPDDPARLRPWLAQVLRNALRRRLRDDGRRRAREQETVGLQAAPRRPRRPWSASRSSGS